jgi:bifunctional non-homologous end joining protein LigD
VNGKRSTRKLQTIGLLSDLQAPLKGKPARLRDKRQSQLAFSPMPRIEPALALLVNKPPNGDQWITTLNGMDIAGPCT